MAKKGVEMKDVYVEYVDECTHGRFIAVGDDEVRLWCDKFHSWADEAPCLCEYVGEEEVDSNS